MKDKIKKVLVANRGEIAIRILRTCRELRLQTVAVYSEIDRVAAHLGYADEAFLIGPAAARKSYLNGTKIIEVAREAGADAIHPGYGFLSENPDFADAVARAGLIFVGPSGEQIRRIGDKTSARRIAKDAGVPIVPGTVEPLATDSEAAVTAEKIGYPVLLKAAGGGGGKGMRLVRSAGELPSALRGSRSEALSAFGDGRVYIEKYIERPRHVEIQVLADSHGNVVHLGERECTIQRRHQKVIEESPSVIVNDALRRKMTDAAIALVKASGYQNAGTVEFIVDQERNFYFLEVNARLQVEHPVTELRTGIDLVREQLKIARGEPLGFRQEEIEFRGHAIEARICAEDPENNFYPDTGRIALLRGPGGFGVREDRGVEEGDDVSAFYDPLMSKLIVWGQTREDALARMGRALGNYEIFGIRNNLRLCQWVIEHPDFRAGEFSTDFLSEKFQPGMLDRSSSDILTVAAITALTHHTVLPTQSTRENGVERSKWKMKIADTFQ